MFLCLFPKKDEALLSATLEKGLHLACSEMPEEHRCYSRFTSANTSRCWPVSTDRKYTPSGNLAPSIVASYWPGSRADTFSTCTRRPVASYRPISTGPDSVSSYRKMVDSLNGLGIGLGVRITFGAANSPPPSIVPMPPDLLPPVPVQFVQKLRLP